MIINHISNHISFPDRSKDPELLISDSVVVYAIACGLQSFTLIVFLVWELTCQRVNHSTTILTVFLSLSRFVCWGAWVFVHVFACVIVWPSPGDSRTPALAPTWATLMITRCASGIHQSGQGWGHMTSITTAISSPDALFITGQTKVHTGGDFRVGCLGKRPGEGARLRDSLAFDSVPRFLLGFLHYVIRSV